ncbi:MAG: NUDIX hydrolase [Parcubacteria group bacterium Gr01-1014_70]|nr:MAG: NUDIX hydrolase [Parcubacteria group bacterium Gr01-1014_70]
MNTPVKLGEPVIMAQKYGKTFRRQDFRYPDGTVKDFWIFDYKNGQSPAVALSVTDDMHVIGVRQFRHAANSVVVEIPGGVLKTDAEQPEEAIMRELPEETGYIPGKIIRLSQAPIWFEPANNTVPYWPLLAMNCRKEQELAPDDTEIIELIVVLIQTWISWIFDGTIRDSKTITTTFLALPHLNIKLVHPHT